MSSRASWIRVITAVWAACLFTGCGDQRCSLHQFPSDFSPEMQALLRNFVQDGAEIQMCALGPYKVGAIMHGDDQSIVVLRGNEPLFFGGPTGSTMSVNGRPVASLTVPPDGSGPGNFFYEAYDPRTEANITVFDSERDGQPELRARRYPDKSVVSEFWFQDRWQTLVKQGDKSGLFIGGKFMTVPELREALRTGMEARSEDR